MQQRNYTCHRVLLTQMGIKQHSEVNIAILGRGGMKKRSREQQTRCGFCGETLSEEDISGNYICGGCKLTDRLNSSKFCYKCWSSSKRCAICKPDVPEDNSLRQENVLSPSRMKSKPNPKSFECSCVYNRTPECKFLEVRRQVLGKRGGVSSKSKMALDMNDFIWCIQCKSRHIFVQCKDASGNSLCYNCDQLQRLKQQ